MKYLRRRSIRPATHDWVDLRTINNPKSILRPIPCIPPRAYAEAEISYLLQQTVPDCTYYLTAIMKISGPLSSYSITDIQKRGWCQLGEVDFRDGLYCAVFSYSGPFDSI